MATASKFVMTDETGQRIADAMEEMSTGVIGDTLAPMFSTSATYEEGDKVIYNKHLWRCTTDISTAGAWDSTKWTQTDVVSEVGTKVVVTADDTTPPSDHSVLWVYPA